MYKDPICIPTLVANNSHTLRPLSPPARGLQAVRREQRVAARDAARLDPALVAARRVAVADVADRPRQGLDARCVPSRPRSQCTVPCTVGVRFSALGKCSGHGLPETLGTHSTDNR
jgi:hypothetical protein